MKFPTISLPIVLLGGALFAASVLVGRSSRPGPASSAASTQVFDVESRGVLIVTGSVEHRLRMMEAQLLELQNKVKSLEAANE
jgi:hypothetical protein